MVRTTTRALRVAVAVVGVLLLLGCARLSQLGSPAPVPTAIQTTRSSPLATPTPAPPSPRNDLRSGRVRRTLTSGQVTVNLTYATPLKVADWSSAGDKPLSVSLSAVNKTKRKQRIYLARVTLRATPSDASGPLDPPKPLVDAATIRLGFTVTPPYQYQQDFVIPAIDPDATALTIACTYELLVQVSANGTGYYKKALVDTLQVPIAS
jgi:hypothetical protein